MMHLSTMQAIVEALDEDGGSQVADEIAARWGADVGSVRFFRASANFVFKFTQAGRSCFLRFNHATERTPESIQAETRYVNHLDGQGVLVARPLPSLNGRFVESVPTALGVFHAVVFEAVAGQQWETAELMPEMFEAWGAALGRLHSASEGYPDGSRPTWRDHLDQAARSLPQEEQAARALLLRLKSRLDELPRSASGFGLIHFDFELDNIVWTESGPAAIDFDDSAHYWFAADIAFALRDLFSDDARLVDLGHADLGHFVGGYRSVRALSQEELDCLPLFLKLHNLMTFAGIHQVLDAGDQPDSPAWVERLRHKLSAKMDKYRDGFSEDVC